MRSPAKWEWRCTCCHQLLGVLQELGVSHAGIRKRIERVREILHQKMSHFAFEPRVCPGEGAVAPEESRHA